MTRLLYLTLAFFLIWTALFLSGTVRASDIFDELAFSARAWWVDASQSLAPDRSIDHAMPAALRPTLSDFHASPTPCVERAAPPFAAMASADRSRHLVGHLPSDLERAPLSLDASCGLLDVLLPDWVTILDQEGRLTVNSAPKAVREDVEAYRNRSGGSELVTTVRLETTRPTETVIGDLLAPSAAQRLLDDLTAAARDLDASGICFDFDSLDADELRSLVPFFARAHRTLRGAGLQTCVVLSVDQKVWSDRAMTDAFDQVILKVFNRTWVGSVPAPPASRQWFEDIATEAVEAIGKDRLTVAIGAFSVNWTTGRPVPEILSYGETAHRVARADTPLRFSDASGNSFARYRDPEGRTNLLWALDATSAHNQLFVLRELGVKNVAIWSLGNEDPTLWRLLQAKDFDRTEIADALSEIRLSNYVQYEGQGPFLRLSARQQTGQRTIGFSETGREISSVEYLRMPEPYTLERYGQPAGNQLVLTFDDGPDRTYTSEILDILKETRTPAAFFVVGERVVDAPDLLQRMINEGHEIGSHTYSHPMMNQVSRTRVNFELEVMHKLISSYTGHDTRLYREPFLRAGGPIAGQRIPSLALAQDEGAIIAGMDIVPPDWEGLNATEIVAYTISEIENGAGNVILLHDGGGNREETVKALPTLISELRRRGYEFTSLGDIVGWSRERLMPPSESAWRGFDRTSFDFLAAASLTLASVFWIVLTLGLVRAVVVFVLAASRRTMEPVHTHDCPKVSVVIPAHNEEAGITACVRRVLDSDYPDFDVIVVDDGSTDDTFEVLQRMRNNPRVKILAQLNRGKSGALNAAIRNTDAEILVFVDADTQIEPDAIRHLVRHFLNPRIGAVAGKVVVGNRVNLLTRLQALEYVTSQNFERRAYDLINGLLVVPGAIGAWRTEAVKKAGMFSHDTVTEDADLTISINRAGYRVSYEDKAIAYTEAPTQIRLLMRQRLRWSLGLLQCVWKHKGAVLQKRTIGRVSLPDLFIFGYLYALMAPIADLYVLRLLLTAVNGDPIMAPATNATLVISLAAYLALPLLELAIAGFALKTDKNETLWLLLLFPFQRFFYRQLLYLSSIRAIGRAISGAFTSWGKQSRMGSVLKVGT